MMKIKQTLFGIAALGLISQTAVASGLSENLGQSVNHSGQAIAYSAVASTQVVAAVVAVPFKVVGAIGTVSDAAGDGLLDYAEKDFPIGEQTVSALPSPNQALVNNSSSSMNLD